MRVKKEPAREPPSQSFRFRYTEAPPGAPRNTARRAPPRGVRTGREELNRIRNTKHAAAAVLGLQAVFLLLLSAHQYSRFGLGVDFATSNQAAFLISHGHLNPFVTTHRYPYLDDHFGLLLYPIALIYLVYPHGIVLLWLQDLAGVGAEMATIWWIAEILGRRLSPQAGGTGGMVSEAGGEADGLPRAGRSTQLVGPAVLAGALVLLVADPWFYTACLFDFHLNAFSALFLVLAARDVWNGRIRRAAIFSVALLLTGDTGGLYLFGLGLSALLGARGSKISTDGARISSARRERIFGASAIAAGIAWVLVVHALAVNQSHVLVASYTYLVTGSPSVAGSVTLFTVAKALVEHPHRWIQLIWGKRKIIYEILIPTGVVGVASWWAVGADLMVFYLQAIAYPLTFLVNGFDVLAGLMVVLACSAMVVVGLATSTRRLARRSAVVLGVAMLAQSLVLAGFKLPEVFPYFLQVNGPEAAALARGLSDTPPGAEVIASWGVMGRFSERSWDEPLYKGVEAEPVFTSTVVFVLTDAGLENDPPAVVAAVELYVRDDLKARVLVDADGVEIFEWHPPPGTTQVSIPNPEA